MSALGLTAIVLLATYAASSTLFSALLALWLRRADRVPATADGLLLLRLLPAGLSLATTLTIALPAFVLGEPPGDGERAGALAVGLALLAIAMLAGAAARVLRAVVMTYRVLGRAGPGRPWQGTSHWPVHIVGTIGPGAATVGAWRPRILASECVVEACSDEEFAAVIAHETAHIRARDNVKRVLLLACPDVLAWTPSGERLVTAWRRAAEYAADDQAAGSSALRRVTLAAAIVKVARLTGSAPSGLPSTAMSAARDEVAGRVRRLLAPPAAERRDPAVSRARWLTCLVPLLAIPAHGAVHEALELLVAFGR